MRETNADTSLASLKVELISEDAEFREIVTLQRQHGDYIIVNLGSLSSYVVARCLSEYMSCIHSFHNLTNMDLLCLRDQHYVNDKVIDFFMYLRYETQEWKNVSFLPCIFSLFILGYNSDMINSLPKDHWLFNTGKNSPHKDITFIPYCLDDHWCLVVLDWRDSTFLHFDSKNYKRDRLIYEKFQQFLERCRNLKEPGPLQVASVNWSFQPVSFQYQKQADGYSCGYFVINYMDTISKTDVSALKTATFDPIFFSRYLLDYFLTYPARDVCFRCGLIEKVEHKDIANKKYQYTIYTKSSAKTCVSCNSWVHGCCMVRFFNDDNKCIACDPYKCGLEKNNVRSEKRISHPYFSGSENDMDMDVQKLIRGSVPAVHKGFENPIYENMCWLNSVLQIFFCLPLFSQFEEIFQYGDSNITDSFLQMLKKWKEEPLPIMNCKEFKIQCGANLNDMYSSDNQQDPSEFINYFIDYINCRYTMKAPGRTLVRDLYFSRFLNHRTCKSCSHHSFICKPYESIINVNVESGMSVDELLCMELTEENVDMYCRICGSTSKTKNIVRHDFRDIPRILIILLKRYNFDPKTNSVTKNRAAIRLSENLFVRSKTKYEIYNGF